MNPQSPDTNEAIFNKLQACRWTGRLLTTAALAIGLLAIAAGILVAMANLNLVMPMEQRLLLQTHPELFGQPATNHVASAETKPASTQEQTETRHLLVTFAQGKELFLLVIAVILMGLGTFLTLLLVIFNRRVTLRQVNANLALISRQIKELQDRGQQS